MFEFDDHEVLCMVAWDAGYEAFQSGVEKCPYEAGTEIAEAWEDGYHQAKTDTNNP